MRVHGHFFRCFKKRTDFEIEMMDFWLAVHLVQVTGVPICFLTVSSTAVRVREDKRGVIRDFMGQKVIGDCWDKDGCRW